MPDPHDDAHDDALMAEFVADSLEHLERVEPALLLLEESGAGGSPDVIHQVFRAVHTIKGASGFFGFHAISHLSHAMENLLTKVREGEVELDAAAADALLAGVDRLRLLLEGPADGREVDVEDVVHRLKDIFGGSVPIPKKPVKTHEPVSEKTPGPSSNEPGKKILLRIAGKPPMDELVLEVAGEDVLSPGNDFVYAVWVYPGKRPER